MKYYISDEYETVYSLEPACELVAAPMHSDNTFDTDENYGIDFAEIDDENFMYCKGVEAFLKKLSGIQ